MKEEKSPIKAQIIHNPTAGDGKHKKEDLIHRVSSEVGEVRYVSTDNPFWNKFAKNHSDVIFLGGGDGTVHKLAKALLDGDPLNQRTPIQLLPLGTANNIARTLKIEKGADENFDLVHKKHTKVDVGRVKGLREETFFLESAGFGIFPRLVSEMKNREMGDDSLSQKLEQSRQVLLEVVENYEAKKAEIEADGEKINGNFLLVELMNIKYIGPNFKIAPKSNPGDGYLDLVLVREEDRGDFKDYVKRVIEGKFNPDGISNFTTVKRVKNATIKWEGKDLHVDDDPVTGYTGERFEVKIEPEAFVFLIKNSAR